MLIEFNFKLTHFHIMSQVALVLHISRSDFMVLMREDNLLINKDNVHVANYIDEYQSMLAPLEVAELNNARNVLQGCSPVR